MVSKKFLTSSIIYTFSAALSTLASFILLPFYTNTGLLKVADFGALSLYIGLSLLVQVLTNMSIDYYLIVEYPGLKNHPEQLKRKIASLNGYMLSIGFVLVLIFALGGKFFLSNYVGNAGPSAFRYMMMSVFTGIFTAHFKFYNAHLINLEKPWRYFWSNMVNFVTTVVFSIVILKLFPLTLEGPLWGRLLSCACIFAWSFVDITYTYGIALSREFLKPTFQFCFPFLVTAFFQWILSYSDRYIIKPLLFNKELAIFDLAVRFTLLVNFLIDGLNSAITPRVFVLMKEGDAEKGLKEINKYYSAFNLVTLLVIPLNILALPLVLPYFIGDEKYLVAFLYFGIICSGFATRGATNLYMFPILHHRKTTRLIWVNGIAAVVQIALGYIMVRYFKLYGAAFTLIAVKILLVILLGVFSRDLGVKKFNMQKLILLPAAVMLIISVAEMFVPRYGLQMHLIHAVEVLSVTTIAYLTYRNEVPDLLKWAKGLLKVKKLVGR